MNKLYNKVIDKITSGRFIITVMLSAVYAYIAIKGQVTTELNATYMMVVAFYFTKQRSPSDKDDTNN